MFFRSERLFLRPGWPEDWQEFDALISEDDVVCSLSLAPWSIAAADVRPALQSSWNRLLPCFMITLPSAQGTPMIGTIGLTEQGSDVAVGFWIARAHRGRGFAKEAMRAVIALARAIGHEQLIAIDAGENPAARAVLDRCGFRRAGSDAAGSGNVFTIQLDSVVPDVQMTGGANGMEAA